jgi:exodeoxyribonuclease VII large subunit
VAAEPQRTSGIPGSDLPGPYAVGEYAARLRNRLRGLARVQLVGEVFGLRPSRARVYFELRDARGAIPCAIWRTDFDALALAPGALADGAQVVVAGGCDYYPGSSTSSPAFSFQVSDLRIAGEGDLLARVQRLRRTLAREGLLEPQKRLPRRGLPRTVGVVTGESGKARDDVLAGLRRRGWAGRVIWAFAPVQDRHAAPAITRALVDLAALPQLDAIVVARGGGSLVDLMAFCDETLCRTVALLAVPVIASVGHHADRTLLDDVAAVSASTPTHAAEAAVPIHCDEARDALGRSAERLAHHGRRAVLERARVLAGQARAPHRHARRAVLERTRVLAGQARAPGRHVQGQRRALHQRLRELRASGRRGVTRRRELAGTHLLVLRRKAELTGAEHRRTARALEDSAARLSREARGQLQGRARELARLASAIDAHRPERTLARGYALVSDRAGEPVGDAGTARRAHELTLRFADGTLRATVAGDAPPIEDGGR